MFSNYPLEDFDYRSFIYLLQGNISNRSFLARILNQSNRSRDGILILIFPFKIQQQRYENVSSKKKKIIIRIKVEKRKSRGRKEI